MNPTTPTGSPSVLRQHQLPGFLIFFFVQLGSLLLPQYFQDPVMRWLALNGGRFGEEPPWYLITRDFAEGICGAGALLLCLGVAVALWRWWQIYAIMLVCMPLMYHGGNIARSWIIYQACPGLLDGERTTSRWLTFHSYLYDPQIAQARNLLLGAGFLLALVLVAASSYFQLRKGRTALQKARRALQSVREGGGQEGGAPPVD